MTFVQFLIKHSHILAVLCKILFKIEPKPVDNKTSLGGDVEKKTLVNGSSAARSEILGTPSTNDAIVSNNSVAPNVTTGEINNPAAVSYVKDATMDEINNSAVSINNSVSSSISVATTDELNASSVSVAEVIPQELISVSKATPSAPEEFLIEKEIKKDDIYYIIRDRNNTIKSIKFIPKTNIFFIHTQDLYLDITNILSR